VQLIAYVFSSSPNVPSPLTFAPFQVFGKGTNGRDAGYTNLAYQFKRIVDGAASLRKTKVVNISLGGGLKYDVDRHGCATTFTTDCENELALESRVLSIFYRVLEYSPAGRPYLAISLAAGNNGLNITKELTFLQTNYQDAYNSILVMGGLCEDITALIQQTAPPGPPAGDFNSSSSTTGIQMLYAPGFIGTPCLSATPGGTSFAAPQGAGRMASLLKVNPALTGPQLVAMMKAGSTAVTNPPSNIPGLVSYNLLPSLEQALFPEPATYTAPFKASRLVANGIGGTPCGGTYTIDGTLTMTLQGNPYLPTTNVPAKQAAADPDYYASLLSGPATFTGTLAFIETPPALSYCPSGSGSATTTQQISGGYWSFQGELTPTVNLSFNGAPYQDSFPMWLAFTNSSFSPDLKTITGTISVLDSYGTGSLMTPITFTKQ
jgi:hypothetical protein